MDKKEFLNHFLLNIRHLTADSILNDDCRVIDYIQSVVPELKKHGYTVGYAFEPEEVHLVGKVETNKSLTILGASMVSIIDEVIIVGSVYKVISENKGNLKQIQCTPLPNVSDIKYKVENSIDPENPFWLIEPVNFNHTSFVGIAQAAYCIGFITDCL
jgi:hypothetical protein